MKWQCDGVRFTILHPDGSGWSDNNGSCVLKIDGPFSVLLPGDIERQAEARLLHEHENELKADVINAPHHGSQNSSIADIVVADPPQVVFFPAGWHTRFHPPRPEVVAHSGGFGAHVRLLVIGELGGIMTGG